MKVTLTRAQAQELIDKVDDNYQRTAVPLIPKMEAKLKQAQSEADISKQRFLDLYLSKEFEEALPRKTYSTYYLLDHLNSRVGFSKGGVYEELKGLLNNTTGDVFHLSGDDVDSLHNYGEKPYTEDKYIGLYSVSRLKELYEEDYQEALSDFNKVKSGQGAKNKVKAPSVNSNASQPNFLAIAAWILAACMVFMFLVNF